ncbi:hypothetical protein PG994_007148 [Apiospora phragmitis]|uniref:DUF7708 domain-containing protein n=1 Tax=Apiospora phragmitis TaxID=2905665 RepID=A0ABR1V001_9PEZI
MRSSESKTLASVFRKRPQRGNRIETAQRLSHSKLVSMIPTNEKYITLLTGSLSAVASACTNHEKLAEGVASSLEELGQDMAYWNGLINLFPNQGMMQRYIMELHTVAFDEQAFHDLFTEKRKRIKSIGNRMSRHAEGAHMQADLTSQRDTRRRQQSEMERTLTQIMHKLGIDVRAVLESKVIRPLDHNHNEPLLTPGEVAFEPGPVMSLPEETPRAKDVADNDETPVTSCCSVRDVLGLLEPIAVKHNYRIQELVRLTSPALEVAVDVQIKRRLRTWISSLVSNTIWIQGPHDVSHPSQNTLAAACLVGLENTAKIPCISYFGSLQSRNARGTYPSPPDILLDMGEFLDKIAYDNEDESGEGDQLGSLWDDEAGSDG